MFHLRLFRPIYSSPRTLAQTPYPYPRFVLATRLPLKFCGPSTAITLPRLVVRASSVDVTPASAIRPGVTVESYKLPSDIRKRAMDAVDACGGTVTIGDVASRVGLKLDVAQRALQASPLTGFLEVSDEGDILYIFPKDYRAKLAGKSFRMKIEPWLEKAKAVAEYPVRVSFGTTLIASIVIVYTTIIALVSSRSEDDNRGRHGGRSYNFGTGIHSVIREDKSRQMVTK